MSIFSKTSSPGWIGSVSVSSWLVALVIVVCFLVTRAAHSRHVGQEQVQRASQGSVGAATDSNADADAALTQYYVSTSGSDSGDGSQAHPFRTVTRAQTAVQALKKAHDDHVPAPGVVVNVASGTYDFSDAPLQFTSEDSGEAAAIVTYRGSD
eukprot:scpid106324/ scgid31936/ 